MDEMSRLILGAASPLHPATTLSLTHDPSSQFRPISLDSTTRFLQPRTASAQQEDPLLPYPAPLLSYGEGSGRGCRESKSCFVFGSCSFRAWFLFRASVFVLRISAHWDLELGVFAKEVVITCPAIGPVAGLGYSPFGKGALHKGGTEGGFVPRFRPPDS